MLQFDAVYRLKTRHGAGLALHSGIVYACTLLLAWPYLNGFTLALVTALGVAHHYLDHLKTTWPRYPPALAGFLVDQAAHVAVAGVTALAAWGGSIVASPGALAGWGAARAPVAGGSFVRGPASPPPAWVVLASGAIAATYVTSFITYYLDLPPAGHPAPYRRRYPALALQLAAYLAAVGAVTSHPAWAVGSAAAAAVQLGALRAGSPHGLAARWAGPVGAVLFGLAAGVAVRIWAGP